MKKSIGFAVAMVSAALLQNSVHGQSQPPKLDGQVVQAKAELSKLDQPLAWLMDAKRNYGAIKDYACTLVSEENVRGKMQDQNIIQSVKVKTEPFCVYMRWLAPKQYQSQEVAYIAGKNNNKMRVKSNVIGAKIVGFMSVDPHDPRVMEHSRHTILEAGIGSMIDQNIRHWREGTPIRQDRSARISESAYNEPQGAIASRRS